VVAPPTIIEHGLGAAVGNVGRVVAFALHRVTLLSVRCLSDGGGLCGLRGNESDDVGCGCGGSSATGMIEDGPLDDGSGVRADLVPVLPLILLPLVPLPLVLWRLVALRLLPPKAAAPFLLALYVLPCASLILCVLLALVCMVLRPLTCSSLDETKCILWVAAMCQSHQWGKRCHAVGLHSGVSGIRTRTQPCTRSPYADTPFNRGVDHWHRFPCGGFLVRFATPGCTVE
jgi:hypothetical protein